MSKLLIVDDEVDIREFAKNFFQKRGIEVLTATGGSQAVEIIISHQPDLVLLDVRMEEMTGVEALRQIRKINLDLKIIMVSGVEDEYIIEEAKALGITKYIHKPLILEELEKIVLAQLKNPNYAAN